MMGMEEGKGVVVRVGSGREEMGVTSVIMGSAVDLDGESMRDFFIGKAEAKTSHNCLPEMVASSGMEENGI